MLEFISMLLAISAVSLFVFIGGFYSGMMYMKERAGGWLADQAVMFAETEASHHAAIDAHLAFFQQNILHEFQKAQETHKERSMSGYYHGSDDNEDDDDADDIDDDGGDFDPSVH